MRLINRPLAFLLAAFLLVASVLLVVEVIGYAITAKPVLVHWTTWYHWAGKTKWKAGVIRFWAGVLMIVGLVLLVLERWPRTPPPAWTVSEGHPPPPAQGRSPSPRTRPPGTRPPPAP